jgi:hypothetical protein
LCIESYTGFRFKVAVGAVVCGIVGSNGLAVKMAGFLVYEN